MCSMLEAHSLVWVLWHYPYYCCLYFSVLTWQNSAGSIASNTVSSSFSFLYCYHTWITSFEDAHSCWMSYYHIFLLLFQFNNSSMFSNSEIISLALPITDKLLRVIHFCYAAYLQHFLFFLRTLDSVYIIHSLLHAAYFLPSAF